MKTKTEMNRRTMLITIPTTTSGCLHAVANADPPVKPRYKTTNADIVFHTTAGYPQRWRKLYEQTIQQYADQFGRVGPTHIFLIENPDWDPQQISQTRRKALLESIRHLKRKFAVITGQNPDGNYLEWQTGNHWAGWSITPPRITITMTMSPIRDALQFVIGPLHEYTHALQTAHGYAAEAIDGNQMGHSRWTGPAWWREGSAVLVSFFYSYLNPQLFRSLPTSISWKRLSDELNRNLSLYQKAGVPIRSGVTHDDWQRLEKNNHVHPVVYAGGSVACALLLKRCGSLSKFMDFLPLVPTMGWERAFEKHFQQNLNEFYVEFSELMHNRKPDLDSPESRQKFFSFLKSMK